MNHSPAAEEALTQASPMTDIPTTSRIVRAVRNGRHDDFGQLVNMFQSKLFALCVLMVRDPSIAEELTQDAFIRAFTRLERYDETRPFYPWLATIATRLGQTRLRRNRSLNQREGASLDAHPEPDSKQTPLGDLLNAESNQALWQAVARLSSGQRTAVFMFYHQDLKINEIALALGVTPGTVKTLLFRARRTLQSQLTQTNNPDRKEKP